MSKDPKKKKKKNKEQKPRKNSDQVQKVPHTAHHKTQHVSNSEDYVEMRHYPSVQKS